MLFIGLANLISRLISVFATGVVDRITIRRENRAANQA